MTFGQYLRTHGSLVGLLAVSVTLLCIWAFAVPVYEAPDEPHHWRYANYLHDTWQLPPYTPELAEANSPPLYYILTAPFAADTAEPKPIVNSDLQSPRPPRFFDETARDWARYWSIRWPRMVSVFISALTVLFCYLAGVEATGSPATGVLVGGLVALLPQFTFRGMNVSNDSLVTMTCAVTTYACVRLVKRGFTWRMGVLAAIAVAAAFLSKTNAIFLPAPVGLAILATPGTWKVRLLRLSLLGISLVVAAPWLIRNQLLYGDPLASRVMLTVVSNIAEIKPLTSPYFYTTFPSSLLRSFVGVFGWMNLFLPAWLYTVFAVLAVAAVLGLIWLAVQHHLNSRLAITLLAFPLLSLAVTVYINLSFSQPQGRYLFPALPAIALLAGTGLEGLPYWRPRATYCLLMLLLLINLCIVVSIIIPAYWA